MIVTRFAPSPTGLLHLGHAYAAITACESGDDFLLRIEDIDKGRSRDHFIQTIFYDLKWLGLSWDEPTLRQSTRMGGYAEALVNLKAYGHAYAAITACESGDDFLLRIEDIDKGRSRDHFIQAIFYDLKWLGLSWDEPTLRQSTRMGAYAEALVNLKAHGLAYPCFCTRAEIAAEIARIGEAQHGPDGPIYPGTCHALPKEEGMRRIAAGETYALRLD